MGVSFSQTPKKRLVPRRGLEPPRLAALLPESSASTNSAIWADSKARVIQGVRCGFKGPAAPLSQSVVAAARTHAPRTDLQVGPAWHDLGGPDNLAGRPGDLPAVADALSGAKRCRPAPRRARSSRTCRPRCVQKPAAHMPAALTCSSWPTLRDQDSRRAPPWASAGSACSRRARRACRRRRARRRRRERQQQAKPLHALRIS